VPYKLHNREEPTGLGNEERQDLNSKNNNNNLLQEKNKKRVRWIKNQVWWVPFPWRKEAGRSRSQHKAFRPLSSTVLYCLQCNNNKHYNII
jgi:hypothetical protein